VYRSSVTKCLDRDNAWPNNDRMSKRRLTRQQAWRIEKVQAERAKRAAKRDASAEQALTAGDLGSEQEGLVVAHYGTQVAVESAPGVSQRCHLRANIEGLVTGDKVIWCEGEPTGVVVAQSPRDSVLSRPDAQGKLKPVAANIDQIILVLAPLPEPHANLIDRYLVAAETVGIEPVILLNKTDLLEQDEDLDKSIDSLLAIYPGLGYQVLRASCQLSDGMTQLHAALKDRTSVFVGQSGVGKSSLVNVLLPEIDLRVGALSETTQKGTHTTTTAQLFHLPHGGTLIDSPGIREFGLWHMTRQQIEAGFREFGPHLGHCKFRDCIHEQEPQCALLAAAASGEISERRLASYRHMVASLEL
jgi:ribosome biogenesis GTPase